MKLILVIICALIVLTFQKNFFTVSYYSRLNCEGDSIQRMTMDIRSCRSAPDGTKMKYVCGGGKAVLFKCDKNCENCEEIQNNELKCNGYVKYTCEAERPIPGKKEHVAMAYDGTDCKDLTYTAYVRNGCNSLLNSSSKIECINGNTRISNYRGNGCTGEPTNTAYYRHDTCKAVSGSQSLKFLKCNIQSTFGNFFQKPIENKKIQLSDVFKIKSINEILNK